MFVTICTLLFTSCGFSDTDDNNADNKNPNSSNPGNKPEDDTAEYKVMELKLQDFNLSREGEPDHLIEDAVISFEISESGDIIGEGSGSVLVKDEISEHTATAEIAISGGKAYISLRADFDGVEKTELLTYDSAELFAAIKDASGIDVPAVLQRFGGSENVFNEWLAYDLMPALGNLNSTFVLGKIEEYKIKLKNYLITEIPVENSKGSKYSVNLDAVSELNELLSEKTIKEAYEQLTGEKIYTFKTMVAGLIASSPKEIVEEIVSYGIDPEKLFLALDKLAAIILGDEDATIEKLFGLDFDILELAKDESYNFKHLIIENFGLNVDLENKFAVDEAIQDFLEAFYLELANKSVFEYLGGLWGMEEQVLKISATISDIAKGAEIIYTKDKMGNIDTISVLGEFDDDSVISFIANELSLKYADSEVKISINSKSWQAGCDISFEMRKESTTDGEIFNRVMSLVQK